MGEFIDLRAELSRRVDVARGVAEPDASEWIRSAIARAWSARYPVGTSPELDWDTGWSAPAGVAGALWDIEDLRESELDRFDSLIADAIAPVRAAAERQMIDALVEAVAIFAEEHPAAPRAHR